MGQVLTGSGIISRKGRERSRALTEKQLAVGEAVKTSGDELSLEEAIGGMPLSQRVFLIAYCIGMSENECFAIVSGFNDGAFGAVLSQRFQDTKGYVVANRGRLLPEAKKMWHETVGIVEDGFRLKMASLATVYSGKRKFIGREEFIIRESVKLMTGYHQKFRMAVRKKDEVEDIDPDDEILARAERVRKAQSGISEQLRGKNGESEAETGDG